MTTLLNSKFIVYLAAKERRKNACLIFKQLQMNG